MSQKMLFKALFLGGDLDGSLIILECLSEFKVGMKFIFGKDVYVIVDNIASRWMEENQRARPDLLVMVLILTEKEKKEMAEVPSQTIKNSSLWDQKGNPEWN